jgi:chemotaxis protein MotB
MARRRGPPGESLNAWPGYVDALSTLLMVIIFVLLVFVLAQAFLSVALSGRDQALDRLNRQMSELSDMLSLERGRTTDLRATIAQLNKDLQTATLSRESLSQQLSAARAAQDKLLAERDSLQAERDQLSARLTDTALQSQAAQARDEQLQSQLAATQANLDAMRQQAAELDRTVQADKATVEAKLSDLAKMAEQMRALTALRDELEKQVQDAAVRATTEEQRRAATAVELAEEKKYGESAKAEIALMTQQVQQLRDQLASVQAALEASEVSAKDKDVQITNLGQRLNAALAQKVEELQRYRSEFFGRLRAVLANRPGIQVVGDRFVFQSEVLFPVGSADLTQAGQDQINQLASTLNEIAKEIPSDVNWLLRVDGHADRQPVTTGRTYASNWELSAGRAIMVVKLLIADGIPANRLAATGFADNQPLDPADTPEAYAKNRRIEIRLTDR